jgi:LysR family hydrogen peroxide-inducible transcriptional activator
MDLGQLKYFIKIVEHGSFTRAAQDCAVSQPALSQQIGKLEKELGQPLLERQGRTVRVTPAGHTLKLQAEKILQLVDDVSRQITDDGQTGRICISAIPTVAPYLLPSILRVVGGQFEQAHFIVYEDVTENLLKKCGNGEVDIGLVALPASAKYLTVEPLLEEELLLALPSGHPLVPKESIVVEDLKSEPFVLLDDVHCLVHNIQSFCNQQRFQPVATSRIQQLATVQNLVAMGYGISFVPRMAIKPENKSIVYRSMSGTCPTRTIAFCWNPYRYQSQLFTNFVKGLREFGDPKLTSTTQSESVGSGRCEPVST